MDNSSLIGTPLPQRHRSLAPSPSPGPAASTSTPNAQQSRSAALFASGGRNDAKASPQLKLSRPIPGSAHKGPSFTPLSPTLTASPSFAGSNFGGSTYGGGDEVALKAEVAKSIARSRIVADAGITSCFKREEDQELYDLFCR